MQSISIKNIAFQKISATNKTRQSIKLGNDQTIVIGGDPYEGPYTVTPSQETQTLSTEGLMATENIVINPIPSNYGLITYSGFELTVS